MIGQVTSRKKHVYSEQPLILTAYLFSQFLLAIINFQAINFCSEVSRYQSDYQSSSKC